MIRTLFVSSLLLTLGVAPALASPAARSPLARQSRVSQERLHALQGTRPKGAWRATREGIKKATLGRRPDRAASKRAAGRGGMPAERIRPLVAQVTEEVQHLVALGNQVPARYGRLIAQMRGGGSEPFLLVRSLPNGKILALKGDGTFTTLIGREGLDGIGFHAGRKVDLAEVPLQAGDLQRVRLRTVQAALEAIHATLTRPGKGSKPLIIAWAQPKPKPKPEPTAKPEAKPQQK